MTLKHKLRFTEAEVAAIPFSNKRTRWHDSAMPGLVLDVTNKAKVFRVYKRIPNHHVPTSVSLGQFPALTVESARKLARKVMADMADGINPNDQKRQFRAAAVTLLDVYRAYIEQRELKPTTLTGYKINIGNYLKDWQNKRLADLTEELIAKRHAELSLRSKAQADNIMRMLRAFYNFAKSEYKDSNGVSLFPHNPVAIISAKRAWNNIGRKQTRLRVSQLQPFLDAIDAVRSDAMRYRQDFTVTVCDYIEFIMFTGLRRGEMMTLSWQDVHLADELFMLKDTKNSDNVELPLTDPLKAILARRQEYRVNDYVFGVANQCGHIVEPRKILAKVNAVAELNIQLHDLRRTYCSIAESLGVGLYTLKRLLNHRTGRNDVTAGYTILTADELREPAQRITQKILQAAGRQPADSEINELKKQLSRLSREQKLLMLAELVH